MKYWIIVLLLLPFGLLAQNKPLKKQRGKESAQVVNAPAEPATSVEKPAVKEKRFVINGTVTGLAEASEISLTDVNNVADTLAKASVMNGTFVLKGSLREPNLYYLNFDSQRKTLLFLGNESITITGDVNSLQNLEVKGSETHNDFTVFQETFNPLFRKLSEMNQRIAANPALQQDDSLMNMYKENYEAIKAAINNFIAGRKSSPVSAFLLFVTRGLDQDIAALEARYNMLDETAQQGFFGKIVGEEITKAKVGAIGTPAIEFTQKDTNGTPVSLSSFRGQYVLIDFWASWCKPCRVENPNVVSAYQKFKDKNFTVLGVSLDRERESWIQAIKEDGLIWTQVSDLKFWSNEVARLYNVEGIPQNFLIDPDGKIVGKNLRGPYLEARLCELLGCN